MGGVPVQIGDMQIEAPEESRVDGHTGYERHANSVRDHLNESEKAGPLEGDVASGSLKGAGCEGVFAHAVAVLQQQQVLGREIVRTDNWQMGEAVVAWADNDDHSIPEIVLTTIGGSLACLGKTNPIKCLRRISALAEAPRPCAVQLIF